MTYTMLGVPYDKYRIMGHKTIPIIKAPTVILPKLEHEARERNVWFFGFAGLPAP